MKIQYRALFRNMLESYSISNPLELGTKDRTKFYTHLKTEWDRIVASSTHKFCVLDSKGKIVASDLSQEAAVQFTLKNNTFTAVRTKIEASDFLSEYKALEEDNDHRDALILLASKYGTRQDKAIASALKVIAEACGYMSADNQKISDQMNKRLWPKVVKEYNL